MTSSLEAVEEKETGRLEAFSDGVFSIAITLLVLELKVPKFEAPRSAHYLIKELLQLWPSYLAYFISFFTILIMWVNHHRIFTYIKRVDNTFLFLNGFLLMLVAFVPFPTAVLAGHVEDHYAVTATAFYTGTYVMIAIAFNILWHYAIFRRRLVGRSAAQAGISSITRNYLWGPPLFFLTFLFAFFNVPLSLSAFTALSFFYAFVQDVKPSRK